MSEVLLYTDHGKEKKGDYCTEGKEKLGGCQYGFVLSLLWILGDVERFLLTAEVWTGSYCVCVSVLAVCSHYYRNESGFSFIFLPCSFISYYFCFYLEKKKRTKYLFFPLCIQLVTEHAFEIPDNIRPGHLIKELSKVIRSVEVRTEATLCKPAENKSLNQETPQQLCFCLTMFTF